MTIGKNMKQELAQQLYKKYPKIIFGTKLFKQRNCELDIDEGWYTILDNLCRLIQNHVTWSRKNRARALSFNRALERALGNNPNALHYYYSKVYDNPEIIENCVQKTLDNPEYVTVPKDCPQVVATQIKEKFGGLRFYYMGGDNYVRGLVAMAETMSEVTCEICGDPAVGRPSAWIKTLCDVHWEKTKNKSPNSLV